jgi:hypothetical protein
MPDSVGLSGELGEKKNALAPIISHVAVFVDYVAAFKSRCLSAANSCAVFPVVR